MKEKNFPEALIVYQRNKSFLNKKSKINLFKENIRDYRYKELENIYNIIVKSGRQHDFTKEQIEELLSEMKEVLELRKRIDLPLNEPKPPDTSDIEEPIENEFFIEFMIERPYLEEMIEKIFPGISYEEVRSIYQEIKEKYNDKEYSEIEEILRGMKTGAKRAKGEVQGFSINK